MFNRLLAILTLAAVVLIGAVGTHNANASGRKATIVGSWIVNVTADGGVLPPFSNVVTNTKDGAVINSDPVFGTGHGAWKRVGHREFAFKFLTLVPPDDPAFPPGTFITVSGTTTLSSDGASASGPFVSVFENPDIGQLLSFTGTVVLERITVH